MERIEGREFAMTIILSALIARAANNSGQGRQFIEQLRKDVDDAIDGVSLSRISDPVKLERIRRIARLQVRDVFTLIIG